MQPELQYGSTASLSVAQNKVLRNTYLLLALTMVPTVVGAFVGLSTSGIIMQHPIMASLLMIGAIIGLQFAIAANRNPACRCAQIDEPLSATLARRHNDANAIALGARLIGVEMAKACVTAFLETDFEGGRHQRRVDQLFHILQESH